MFRRLFRIQVDIPALDALLEFLRGNDQAEIDALGVQVQQATAALKQSTSSLQSAIQTQKGN